jgi:hypothetical protein
MGASGRGRRDVKLDPAKDGGFRGSAPGTARRRPCAARLYADPFRFRVAVIDKQWRQDDLEQAGGSPGG